MEANELVMEFLNDNNIILDAVPQFVPNQDGSFSVKVNVSARTKPIEEAPIEVVEAPVETLTEAPETPAEPVVIEAV